MMPIIIAIYPWQGLYCQAWESYINYLLYQAAVFSPLVPPSAPQPSYAQQPPSAPQPPFVQQPPYAVQGSSYAPPWAQAGVPGSAHRVPMPAPPPMFHPQQYVKKCFEPRADNRQNLEQIKASLAAQMKQIDETLATLEKVPQNTKNNR